MPITEIKNLTWSEEFDDDDIICVPIRFTDQNGLEHDLTLWWCGPDGYAAVKYHSSSPEAMIDLLKLINDELEDQ